MQDVVGADALGICDHCEIPARAAVLPQGLVGVQNLLTRRLLLGSWGEAVLVCGHQVLNQDRLAQ